MKKYLGLDIGTTSLKAAVFDECGKRLALRSVDYVLDTDPATGFIEFDAEEYVRMCTRVTDELAAEVGGIDALSVDTQGETMIFADAAGNALYPAINWLDNRASAEADEIRAHFGNKRVYEVTGQPEITAGWPACKALWFRRHHPELWEKTAHIFLLEDWILFRMSGRAVTEPTIQSSSIWYDVVRGCWWQEMLEYIGVPASVLPEMVASASAVGSYKGIRVVAGGLDQIAGTIGSGVTGKGRVSEMTGTIMAICALTDTLPPYNPQSIIPCHVHAIRGKYCLILWSSTAGMALKWFRNTLCEDFSFRQLDELAKDVAPGCEGLAMLPYFCGSAMPRYDPDARAVFAGLTLGHTRGHMARAIMEAVAYTLRQDLEYISDATGDVGEIRITGGGASSPLWSQIKSDVTGKTLHTLAESETACLGTAIFAMVGDGRYASIEEAAEQTAAVGREYTPSGADYEAAYENWCALDRKMAGIN